MVANKLQNRQKRVHTPLNPTFLFLVLTNLDSCVGALPWKHTLTSFSAYRLVHLIRILTLKMTPPPDADCVSTTQVTWDISLA